MPAPASVPFQLRAATPHDLPSMVRVFKAAFSPGPWSAILFPPRLRSQSTTTTTNTDDDDDDETAWRLRVFGANLSRPGHTHVVASQRLEGGETLFLGWAHWVVRSGGGGHDDDDATTTTTTTEEKAAETERIWGTPDPPGLDKEALARLGAQAEVVEGMAREALGAERWRDAIELHYLSIDPQHQRKGVGRVLAKEGLGRASAEGRDVWLRATVEGRRLYLSLGFEEVGEGRVCGQRQIAMVKRTGSSSDVA